MAAPRPTPARAPIFDEESFGIIGGLWGRLDLPTKERLFGTRTDVEDYAPPGPPDPPPHRSSKEEGPRGEGGG